MNEKAETQKKNKKTKYLKKEERKKNGRKKIENAGFVIMKKKGQEIKLFQIPILQLWCKNLDEKRKEEPRILQEKTPEGRKTV
jgi:hypothetical protein